MGRILCEKGKHHSCGVIFWKDNKLFLGKVSGGRRWDIPKGKQEEGEDPVDAAVRETFEEIGFLCRPGNLEVMFERVPYTPSKDLTIFLYVGEVYPDPTTSVCTSFFSSEKGDIPEINGFGYFSKSASLELCSDSMQSILSRIFTSLQ